MTLDVERTTAVDRRDLHAYVDAARGPAHARVDAGAGARRAHVRPLTDDAGQRVERPHLRLTGSARRAPPACAGRAPDRRRRDVHQAELPPGPGRRAAHLRGRAAPRGPGVPGRAGARHHLRGLPARRRPGHGSGDDRLEQAPECGGDDQLPARRLADRLLLRQAHGARRELRLRAVRGPAGRRSAPARGSPSSSRRTPGRPTTSTTPTATAGATRGTRASQPAGDARSPVPQPRRAAVLLPLRPGLPALAVLDGQDRRLPLRPGPRGRAAATSSRAPTT